MRRLPKDQLDYFKSLMSGDPSPVLPKRDEVEVEKGPIPKNTPEALHWLFSPHKDGRPTKAFGPQLVINPEIYWEPWTRPNPGLPIDECIERLIIASGQSEEKTLRSRPKAKRGEAGPVAYEVREMISRDEFSNLSHKNGEFGGHECPYAYTRQRLAEAVGLAYDAIDDDQERRSTIPKNIDTILKDLASAKSSIESAVAGFSKIPSLDLPNKYTRNSLLRPSLNGSLANRHDRSKLNDTLSIIADIEGRLASRRKAISRKGRRESVWWISFVMSCGSIWTTLTRVPPKLGHPGFENFLEASVKSLGGKRSEFQRPIETALEYLIDMEPWDQLDAELNGILSPEIRSVKIYNEEEARFFSSRLERSVLSDIERFKDGDATALQSIQMSYIMTDARGKKLIQDLMERHNVAAAFQGASRVNH